jgi:hypothetical protein
MLGLKSKYKSNKAYSKKAPFSRGFFNAPARFDMGFILLMVLSAYYLIRRKRQFVQ